MKKLLTAAACAAMALGVMSTPINAASGINKAEQEILDYMEKGVSVQGDVIAFSKTSEEYNTMAEYFDLDGVDMTEADVTAIKGSAKNVQAFLEKHWDDVLTPELVQEMLELMEPAMATVEMKVSYDAVNDTLIIADLNGEVLEKIENFIYGEEQVEPGTTTKPETKPSIKDKVDAGTKLENTGEDFTSTYAIFAGLAVILAGAGFVATKKKSVRE